MTQHSFSRIGYEARPPAARITLKNPPLNVIDVPMMEEICTAMAEAESRSEIGVLVFSGGEEVFSAGVDVAAHRPEHVEEMLTKFHAVFRGMVKSQKILVAAVRGHCMGGGAELAMMCDLVITSEAASWKFPEISLACFPPVAAVALATIVGQKQAADLILTGRKMDGLEAQSMGLANSAVRDDRVEATLEELLARLSRLSPTALAITKKALYVWDAMHFDKGLARAEKIYLEELMQTDDAREGIQAFLEKREPRWK